MTRFNLDGGFTVASFAAMVYDWALTLGHEIELIWRQYWSLMTILYVTVRYIGIPYTVINMLVGLPSVSLTDIRVGIMMATAVSNNMNFALNWTNVVVTAMLDVIMIARLYAMYQGSRKMLIFLVVIFLAVNIACGVLTARGFKYVVGEELIFSGIYICSYDHEGDVDILISAVWILTAVWEVLALCLAVWIAVKHFRDLRRLGPSTGSIIENCFTVLIKSHVLYFASFAAVASLQVGYLSPMLAESLSAGSTYVGILQILLAMQMFVLGPRLILSVREYNAKLMADSVTVVCDTFHFPLHLCTSSPLHIGTMSQYHYFPISPYLGLLSDFTLSQVHNPIH
ncbi:uncharacterized protein EDB91DRAFT_1254062 [Suillus paluster]|uniref:uncharacterized protein n=1 Tax=Suillus paluster TaxID=48578 RepID=UPI001B865D2E|nr:uncharacterized protein EDB91DRAFT_1254062 [Suillus paluster]KAG1727094.1 hypothetical protein EDB91DRAFT_1254062 [Suillus paluster]